MQMKKRRVFQICQIRWATRWKNSDHARLKVGGGGERGNGTERARARIRAHDLIIFIQPRCSMAGLNIAARPLPLHPVTLQIVGLFRVERAAGEGGICCPV